MNRVRLRGWEWRSRCCSEINARGGWVKSKGRCEIFVV
jgi:hypothetical protein